MGRRKSYSRQTMQKFIAHDVFESVAALSSSTVLSVEIPEEVVVKRIVATVAGVGASPNQAYFVSVTQSLKDTASSDDDLEPNALIRTAVGTAESPVNLDYTLTMRKMSGSGVHLIVRNNDAADMVAVTCKLTIHYLEV